MARFARLDCLDWVVGVNEAAARMPGCGFLLYGDAVGCVLCLCEAETDGVQSGVYGINAPAGNKSGKFAHASTRCPRVPAS